MQWVESPETLALAEDPDVRISTAANEILASGPVIAAAGTAKEQRAINAKRFATLSKTKTDIEDIIAKDKAGRVVQTPQASKQDIF